MGTTVLGNSLPYCGTTIGDWDTVTIGQFRFAGTKITIEGTCEYKFDVAPAPGTDGARETPQGYLPADVTISLELWDDIELPAGAETAMQAWALVIGAYKPKPGKTKPVPITVDHPLLRMMNLSRFYVRQTPVPRFVGNQTYEGRIRLLEYFGAPVASGKQSPVLTGATIFSGNFESKPTTLPKPSSNNTGP